MSRRTTIVTVSLALRRPHRVCARFRADDGDLVLQLFGQQLRLRRDREGG